MVTKRQARYDKYDEIIEGDEAVGDLIIKVAEVIYDGVFDENKSFGVDPGRNKVVRWIEDVLVYGDVFLLYNQGSLLRLNCTHVYRVETVKGKLLEFQHGTDGGGVDYEWFSHGDRSKSKVDHYKPSQIIHIRGLNSKKEEMHPYGCSLLEFYLAAQDIPADFIQQIVSNVSDGLREYRRRKSGRCDINV